MYDQGREVEAAIMLCDYAQVHGGKLYATGAAVNMVSPADLEPPYSMSLYAAVVITVPWQTHNQLHKLAVSLIDEDGGKVPIAQPLPGAQTDPDDEGSFVARFNAGRGPIMQAGDETLLAVAVPLNVKVPRLGAYRAVVHVDGTEIAAARFRVLQPQTIGLPTAHS